MYILRFVMLLLMFLNTAGDFSRLYERSMIERLRTLSGLPTWFVNCVAASVVCVPNTAASFQHKGGRAKLPADGCVSPLSDHSNADAS